MIGIFVGIMKMVVLNDILTVLSRIFILLHIMLCWNCILTSLSSKKSSQHLLDQVFPSRLTCHEVEQRLMNISIMLPLCPDAKKLDGEEYIYFGINSSKRMLYFQLKLSSSFLAPTFNIEEMVGDLYSQSIVDDGVRKCFYEGNIVNDETSKVTMSICEGLRGVIRSPNEDIFIVPAPETKTTDGEHTLYIPEIPPQTKNHKTHSCGTPESFETRSRKVFHDYKLVVNASGAVELVSMKLPRQRRAASVKRYIEMMVVTDESMFEFYGRNEIELRRYILSVMAIVTSVMKDRSIGNFVELAVIKLIILKKNPPTLKVNGAASTSLRRFCKWQKRQNKNNDDDPEHFDTAILLTRNDLCSTSCDTLGLAELGTACDPLRSCSIVEDNGLSSAFTIAHELGHLLNAPHDGDNNECDERSGKVHLMTPTFNQKSKTWTWSSCSRKSVTNYLESTRASCLLDKPSPKFEHPLPLKLPGEMFSLQEQCQLVYGDNSTFCNVYGRCHQLWCTQYRNGKKACQSNNMPWADGTKCGSGKVKSWCIRGKCKKKQNLKPVHGQWGSWSAFDGCSRTCGGGIKFAKRKCNKPKPVNSGNYCIGNRHKYKSCNTQTCPYSKFSFRAIQCNTFNGKDLQIPGVSTGIRWLPKMEDSVEGSCKLFCEMKGHKGIYYELSPKVIDGTKCRRDTNDVCVDGRCRMAGCDNVLNSHAKVDNCGICNGDNSTCRTYTGYKNSYNFGYNFVARIPPGASHLQVLQQSCKPGTHDTNFLALLNHNRRYIFNGHWTVSFGYRVYRHGGTTIYYSGANPENETITIPSTLNSAVEIQVLSTDASKKCNIKYSYNFPVDGKQTYRWRIRSTWSECFPICKGFQIKEYQCEREMDSQVVSYVKCIGTMPEPKYRSCNEHCELRWKSYPSECVPVGICGNGVQEQKIECVVQYEETLAKENTVVTHKDCHKAKIGRKPAREIPCYTPCSTVRWIYSRWSECNQSCGGGTQFRKGYCVMQAGNSTILSQKCTNKTIGLVEKPCSTHQCPKWFTGAWPSDCSVTCGEGQMSRSVYCTLRGVMVSDDMCNRTKPDSTRPCVMGSCADWKYNAWSKCSKPCGGGYQIREVYCETGNGEKVDNLECERRYKPKNRQKCFVEPCVLWASLIYLRNVKWHQGDWSTCSRSCGGGYLVRTVECISNNNAVSEDNCNAAGKPKRKKRCNTISCPFWRHGAWSMCTQSCGKGDQTRLVLCGYNGTIVTNEYCANKLKPDEERVCNTHKCRRKWLSQEWKVSAWSHCSISCGFGLRSRNVTCNRKQCSASSKPSSVHTCNKGSCPGWNYGQWTPCYTALGCGDGWQARLVVCQKENGSVLSDKSCDKKSRPANKKYCTLEPCHQNADWKISAWQPCNVPCGVGAQFRYVFCEDKQGTKLPEELCSKYKTKPIEEKQCTRTSCPTWHASKWTVCDQSCYQRREIECLQGDDRVDDTLCALDDRPTEERECISENCIKDPVFTWKIEHWSPCGETCGNSLRFRIVTCTSEKGHAVTDTQCLHLGKKPKTRKWCFDGPCLRPEWIVGPWEECSLTCGIGETKRNVYCVDKINVTQDDRKCAKENMPANMKVCNIHQCPSMSCREFQHAFGINVDGEQTLTFGNMSLRVHCEGMHRNNPKEYITLKADPKENFAEVYGKRLRKWKVCPDHGSRQMPCVNCIDYRASGVTFFKKVRIDVTRMVIIPEDRMFADRYGQNPPAFASAGDCYSSASCPQGRFILNFEGTGLRVNDKVTWTSMGFYTSKEIYRSRNGQIIHGKCGGNCGMCSPSKKYGLKVEIINR